MSHPFVAETMCGGASKRTHEPCRMYKGLRTDHPGVGNCFLHGGTSPNGRKHAITEAAQLALAKFGVPVEREATQALRELVWEAVGNVAFLRERANALLEKEGIDALVGKTYAIAQREAVTLPIGEEARGVVKLYGEWCDRLAKYAKAAIDAGIAEREITLAEQQADIVVAVVLRALDGLPDEEFERRRELAASALVEFSAQSLGSRN